LALVCTPLNLSNAALDLSSAREIQRPDPKTVGYCSSDVGFAHSVIAFSSALALLAGLLNPAAPSS
jgi:hypothetical protein